MFRLIECEFLKIKRSYMLLLGFLAAALTPFIETASFYGAELKQINWTRAFADNCQMFNMLIGAYFFGLFAYLIFVKEYQNHTINNIMTSPHSRNKIFFAKIFVLFSMITITMIMSYIIMLLTCFILPHPQPEIKVLIDAFLFHIYTVFIQFAIVMPVIAVCLYAKSFMVTLGSVIIVTIAGVFFLASDNLGLFYPWSSPVRITFAYFFPGKDGLNPTQWVIVLSILTGIFIIFLVYNLIRFAKSDIHAGS